MDYFNSVVASVGLACGWQTSAAAGCFPDGKAVGQSGEHYFSKCTNYSIFKNTDLPIIVNVPYIVHLFQRFEITIFGNFTHKEGKPGYFSFS